MTLPLHPGGAGGEVPRFRVVVIGAGRAGLAASHALQERGLRPDADFIVVDAATSPEETVWRKRWHSLTLHETAHRLSLPGSPMSGDPHRRPRTDEMADYLHQYTANIGVIPRWNIRVDTIAAETDGETLSIATSDGTIRAGSVVAATGEQATPRTPAFASRPVVPGVNIHSDSYTHPKAVPPGTVLVVGGGASGREIAHELAHSHQVTLSTSAEQKSGWLTASGVELPLELLRAHGVSIVDRTTDATETAIHTADGKTITPRSVIWATGYRHGFDYLPQPALDPAGHILHRRGITPVPGVFVLGLDRRKAAGTTRVVRDAARIARLIRRRP
jgi:putative flavoprotein involved in K+ transport